MIQPFRIIHVFNACSVFNNLSYIKIKFDVECLRYSFTILSCTGDLLVVKTVLIDIFVDNVMIIIIIVFFDTLVKSINGNLSFLFLFRELIFKMTIFNEILILHNICSCLTSLFVHHVCRSKQRYKHFSWLDLPLRNNCVINDNGYVPFVVITIQSFPHTWLVTRVTRRVSLVDHELLTLPDFTRFLCGSCCSIFSVLCSVLYISLFVLLSFLLYVVRLTGSDYRFDVCKLFFLTPNNVYAM